MNRDGRERDLISIVVPTYRRAGSLREAVESALRQTYRSIEVVVVADGPDALAREAVAEMDPRVRYFELAENAGPAAARNRGVAESRGEWITFIDDDDLMLPERLERQVAEMDRATPRVMSCCQMMYRREAGGGVRDDVWPSRAIATGEDLGDYLLVRPSLLGRPGVVALQALLLHHSVARAVPMPSFAEHEDWAWLLELWHVAGARVRFLMEPLVVYRIDTSAKSRSRRCNWQDSLHFCTVYRHWLSSRAFTAFVSSKVALKARQAGSWAAMRRVFGLLWRNSASPLDYAYFFGIGLVPVGLAQRLWRRSLGHG